MAEILTNVYDILIPSPPALKEIVSISIAAQLWRQEINSHRIKNTLSQLNLKQNILSDDPTPRIPATTMPLIKKHVKGIGLSIEQWLKVHSDLNLFNTEILNDFTDFVGDFDGTIHHDKTARKMVLCERIDEVTRFKVACTYCFEDVISRIWPSISSHFKSTSDFRDRNRVLYYWLCRMKNQLYKLHRSEPNRWCIEAELFRDNYFLLPCWSSFKYFWHRAEVDGRTQLMTHLPEFLSRYYRFLLPKFEEAQLIEFTNTKGHKILRGFFFGRFNSLSHSESSIHKYVEVQDQASYTMAIWAHIRDKLDENTFSRLIRKMIRAQDIQHGLCHRVESTTCNKFWKSAPNHLKQHAMRGLLIDNVSLFEVDDYWERIGMYPDFRFLLIVLSDVAAEDGITFWNKYWRSLLEIMCTEQLAQLMSSCFHNDENRIFEFKLNFLSVLQNIREKCKRLLEHLRVEELSEFVNFCGPDEQTRKSIRNTLLVEEFRFIRDNMRNIPYVLPLFNNFINDAFDDIDLAAQFKTQLLSSPSTKAAFIQLLDSSFHKVDGSFFDVLAPSQQAAREFKRLYFGPLLKQKYIASSSRPTDEDEFSNFISGCVGNEDETARFKETLNVDEIVQDAIRCALNRFGGMVIKYNSFLVRFLEWYFNTPQALEEFKAKYVDDDVFVHLTTREPDLNI